MLKGRQREKVDTHLAGTCSVVLGALVDPCSVVLGALVDPCSVILGALVDPFSMALDALVDSCSVALGALVDSCSVASPCRHAGEPLNARSPEAEPSLPRAPRREWTGKPAG